MNPRAIAAAWGLPVTAAFVLVPLAVRDRLPEPMATHWGPDGRADGSMSFTGFVAMGLLLWCVPWAVLLAGSGWAHARRAGRMYWWGTLGFMSVFAPGISLSTLDANLDVPVWTAAQLSAWHVVASLAGSAAVAVAAGYLGRGEPDEPPSADARPPRLRLREGERTVWVSRVSNPWPAAVAAASGAGVCVLIVLRFIGSGAGAVLGVTLPVLVLGLVLGLLSASVAVRVSGDGVAIRFGPFGWPVRRIRLPKIDVALSETRHPSQVGGWGFRGLPGSATIMLRGGECLIIRYRSGGQLAISIDDAARGASLINALIAERVEQ
ncbi:DUF1648 domain-containing protein [Nonomuraea diastatica]|uniref:DUF1648 domain-containing protein n=1 Tax=Nonomuraea diastatica TaxID=1848329 RepID=A0A4R4VJP0_9ACTN|nr:DUF1648 domain-containing protein [Nonomuraea diastatica]TDD05948.1 DUF1648 domain-containing protein [Nonomuraea diastatica]